MSKKRKKRSAQFKAKVALAALTTTHRCHIIEANEEIYRLRQARQKEI